MMSLLLIFKNYFKLLMYCKYISFDGPKQNIKLYPSGEQLDNQKVFSYIRS